MRWLILVAPLVAACSTVELTGPAPERDAGHGGPCPSLPTVLCDATAPTENGCIGEPDASDFRRLIPVDARYPLGCRINFPDPAALPRTGECTTKAQCQCVDPTGQSGTGWKCIP